MPGYEIIPIFDTYCPSWINSDALHCRTHGVANREMLHISHYPLFGTIDSESGYALEASIYSYAGNELIDGSPILKYSINEGDSYDEIEMTLSSKSNTYTVTIPEQEEGTEIWYYINAEDEDEIIANHPPIGEPDPHIFTAGEEDTPTVNVYNNAKKAENFNIYPNPSSGNFFVWVNLNELRNVNIKITSITCKIIYNNSVEMNSGGDMQNINITGTANGIYNIEIKTGEIVQTKKIIIMQ